MSNSQKKTTDWREFEQFVATCERLLVPRGAIVTSPDRIRDLVTGRKREVDASIRFSVGSTPILITVECRDRKRTEDDTWIEQLSAKREKLGAAKTIAVSSSGFSSSATTNAHLAGIELRRISDITEDEIGRAWIENVILTFTATQFDANLVSVTLADGRVITPNELDSSMRNALDRDGIYTPLFSTIGGSQKIGLADLFGLVETSDIVLGKRYSGECKIVFHEGALLVRMNQCDESVVEVCFTASFCRVQSPVEQKRLLRYASAEESFAFIAEGEIATERGNYLAKFVWTAAQQETE